MNTHRARYYGLKGNGSYNNTDRLAAFLQDWAADTRPIHVALPPGEYVIDSEINITSDGLNRLGGCLSGHGATIIMDGADDYALALDHFPDAPSQWRNLTIEGLRIQGAGIRASNRVAGQATAYSYMLTFRDVTTDLFGAHGLWLDGSWETQVYNQRAVADPTNLTGDCIHVTGDGGATRNPSSLDIFAPTARHGRHGLYAENADINIYGGTYLFAQEEGIQLTSVAAQLIGPHVEDNGRDGVTTVGARLTGWGNIIGGKGTVSDGAQDILYSVYAAKEITVTNPLRGNDMATAVHCDGVAGGSVTLVGVNDHTVQPGTPATVNSL